MANILVSTLGNTWQIIAETLGYINYSKVDFYKNHTDFDSIRKSRKENFCGEEVDELWLVATDKQHIGIYNSTEEDLSMINKWNADCGGVVKKIRAWILSDVNDIINGEDAEAFHDLTLRVVKYARQQINVMPGKLFLSLACGRKTMSADMQDAAYCFGCDAMIHIISTGKQMQFQPTEHCLGMEKISTVYPLCLGKYRVNEILSNCTTISFGSQSYQKADRSTDFLREVRARQEESQFFYTSYYLDVNQKGRSNFRILYTLEPEHISRIQTMRMGVDISRSAGELCLLRLLPKTDLHCHLGGVLDTQDLVDVASCYMEDIEKEKLHNEAFRKWAKEQEKNIRDFRKPRDWKGWRRKLSECLGVNECLINACFLMMFAKQESLLDKIIFDRYLNEGDFCKIGIEEYEALGDLQGSALLQTEKSIRRAVRILLDKAKRENVVYLEIRCSPMNYVHYGLNGRQVLRSICEEMDKENDIHLSLLLIASRHADIRKIEEGIRLMNEMESDELFVKYFRGFDLAGNEEVRSPAELRNTFDDILKDCRNITIHAGETADVNNIWQAVYLLNAERVGHGLTLRDNPDLLNKFLERRIGIEMCPSSNFQIVGFRDNYIPSSRKQKIYPLREYLDKELQVCINTDDPGISRTNSTDELLRAARLTENGLTLWEILQLIYNGLQMAFYPYNRKKQLIHDVENRLGELIEKGKI